MRTTIAAAALAALVGLGATPALAQAGPPQMEERFERMEMMQEMLRQQEQLLEDE